MSVAMQHLAGRAWDVAIIGAGPAGAVAAALLAGRGRSVLLVERARFPREKVCGGCLNGSAIASLRQAGLEQVLRDLPVEPVRALRLSVGASCLELALPGGCAISRRSLDAALAGAAAGRGATFVDGTSAHLLPAREAGWRTLLLRSGERQAEVRAALVLACDGLRGTLLDGEPGCAWRIARRSRMGISAMVRARGDRWERGIIRMAVAREGYAGAVRVEDGQLNVAAAIDPGACRDAGGPAALVGRILGSAGLPVPDLGHPSGTPLLTRRRQRLGAHRVLAVGDASGYVEPFTGEGIGWALAGALAVSGFAEEALARWDAAMIDHWTAAQQRLLRRRRAICSVIAQALRRPLLVSAGIGAARVLPAVAGRIVDAINRPPALDLTTPAPEPA